MAKKNAHLPPFVENVKGSGNWHYRRDVPADVQAALAKIEGRKRPRTRWSQSLKTADQREAARQARLLAAQHQHLIDAVRRPKPVQTDEDKAMLKYLDGRAREMSGLRDEANSMREWAAVAEPALAFEDFRIGKEDSKHGRYENGRYEQEPLPDPDWAHGEAAAMVAKADYIEGELARASVLVDKANLGEVPTLAEALATLPPDAERMTLTTLCEVWKRVRKPVAANQFEVPVREFERLHGPLLLQQITKRHVIRFRDKLASSGLKESTAAKHLRCILTLFKHATSAGLLEHSPAEGVGWEWEKRKASESSAESRRTFTVAEVRALLAKADSLPKDRSKQDIAWFLRVLLWTGCRPEELSQSSPDDIAEVGGIWCFRIHDRGEKKLKNHSSMRDIPLHPKLIEAGFLAFVETRKGGALLFSSLKADGRGRVYQRMQRRLSRLIRGVIADERAVPYSFRHTFRDLIRLAEVPAEVGDRLMGHTSPGRKISQGYGGDQIAVLAKWVARLDPLDETRTVAGVG
jgi:integrase